MYTMDQIHHIRQLFYGQGMTVTEVEKLQAADGDPLRNISIWGISIPRYPPHKKKRRTNCQARNCHF